MQEPICSGCLVPHLDIEILTTQNSDIAAKRHIAAFPLQIGASDAKTMKTSKAGPADNRSHAETPEKSRPSERHLQPQIASGRLSTVKNVIAVATDFPDSQPNVAHKSHKIIKEKVDQISNNVRWQFGAYFIHHAVYISQVWLYRNL